ncbi:hypothetical protein [Mangrovibacter phragmitis]|jgi:hypothetical protein|uniref:hypothetical protein n=1 Tax=Mangrovibacter phragmitis TaxID=1691903 RepID=UPI0012E8C4BB|nr:hypothetical protein [Mangrovibacter phragmitis]
MHRYTKLSLLALAIASAGTTAWAAKESVANDALAGRTYLPGVAPECTKAVSEK